MATHNSNVLSSLKDSLRLGAVLLTVVTRCYGIDIVDDFDVTELDASVWESTGNKTASVSDSAITWADDGGDWGSGDISTQKRLFLPPTGETTVVEWTLGPAGITTPNPGDDGKTVRYQIGLHSANETNPKREHWVNTTGGIWIDLDVMSPSDTANSSGNILYADDTKVANSAANTLAGASLIWNWEIENKVIRLEFTEDEYTWFDGATVLATQTWIGAGIDTEFDNGYRVLALGMNFNGGRTTTSFEKISITNAAEPPAILTSFASTKLTVTSGEKFNLNWVIADGVTASIDQGIGNVDAQTNLGIGSLGQIAPDTLANTNLNYTLTVMNGGETATRTIQVSVVPAPELCLDHINEEFEGDFLNPDLWEHIGNRSYTVSDGKVNWAADGGDWGHGEVVSTKAFPIPEAGKSTTITWTLGSNSVTTSSGDGTGQRPLLGIASAFEREPYSKQHWQNTTGGIWLDLNNMGDPRTDGVSGEVYLADDTKTFASNGTSLTGVDISAWNWKTENHLISLVLTDTGFTWLDGETSLYSGTYAENNLDDEFSKGFLVLMSAINHDIGRGTMSLESIIIDNAGADPLFNGPINVTGLSYHSESDEFTLTWNSILDNTYSVYYSTDLIDWTSDVDDAVNGGDGTTIFTFDNPEPGTSQLYFRVEPPR